MRAAVHTRYGPPEVVTVTDVPVPELGDDEVLVRVRATTVNRTDCGFRAARPFIVRPFSGLVRPRATVLGCEFAGEIEAVGPAVSRFGVGDELLGYTEGRFGCHAEYLAVGESASVATKPSSVGFAEAAACTEGAHYALSFLETAGLAAGDRVLVNGGTGGIGSAAVQLAKLRGATVTAVCGPDHLDLLTDLGADRVVDYTSEDFTADPDRYDIVFDAVGKSSFGRCRRLLAPKGIYVSSELGPWSQNPLLALVTPLGRGRRVRFPVPKDDQAIVERLRDLLASGAFRPVIDRSYPLAEIVDAYRYVETGEKIGNVVIEV